MKILILCPYPNGFAPSQRFRFEQYFSFLKNNNIEINQQGFLDKKTWLILYKSGNQFGKIKGILTGFLNRLILLFSVFKYDFVLIHREATPLGPPILEWFISKVFQKKIIYDFDDAIWLPNTSQENKIVAALKCHSKVKWICKWSYKVSCGNNYLADFARQYNTNVEVVPTTIDTKYHRKKNKIESRKSKTGGKHEENQESRVKNPNDRVQSTEIGDFSKAQSTNPQQADDIFDIPKSSISNLNTQYSILNTRLIIGWTGTHSTEKYLNHLVPVLQELEKTNSFIFRVISNHNPQLPLKSFEYQPWNKATEIEDLSQFDIGVMPLEDNEWAKGKCGFKGLQYMALGIPTVMSPVGVNVEIIESNQNGFLAASPKEWKVVLSQLMEDSLLRIRIGKGGETTIRQIYSVEANEHVYLSLFRG